MPTSAVLPGLESRLAEVRERLSAAAARAGRTTPVTLVAVTKTHPAAAVAAIAAAGVADVAENKVQEALEKMGQVSAPVRWHLIGHLQRNKAKHATRFSLVHSMDSERLAEALDAAAAAAGQRLPVLVQMNVSGEETKGGFTLAELPAVADRLHARAALEVRGVMTMAPYTDDEHVLRATFGGARAAAVLRAAGHPADELSMGMSNDYEVAVEEGATMVRLGSVLFGTRS